MSDARATTKRHAVTAVAFITLVMTAPDVMAGAWTQAEGEYYLKVWNRTLVGSGGYLGDGRFFTTDDMFVDTSINAYFELGLFDGLTVIGYGTPFGWATYGSVSTAYASALGAGVRAGHALGTDALRGALELRYAFLPPLGERTLRRGPSWDYTPTVSTHRLEAEIQLGWQLPRGVWLSAAAGGRYATRRGLGWALFGTAQAGWVTPFGLVAEAHLNWHESLDDIIKSNIAGSGDTSYIGIGFSASVWLTETWAFYAGLEGGLVIRANAATPSIMIGVEHRG